MTDKEGNSPKDEEPKTNDPPSTKESFAPQIQAKNDKATAQSDIKHEEKEMEVKSKLHVYWERYHVVINAIYAFITLCIFVVALISLSTTKDSIKSSNGNFEKTLKVTTDAANAAKGSADAAKSSAATSANYYDLVKNSLKRSDSLNGANLKIHREYADVQRRIIDFQNKESEDNRKLVELENKPIVQILYIKIIDSELMLKRIADINFSISDVGRLPVKIQSISSGFDFGNYPDDYFIKYNDKMPRKKRVMNIIINSARDWPFGYADHVPIQQNEYNEIMSGNHFIYYYGEIRYADLQGKPYTLSFIYKIVIFPRFDWIPIVNNIDP